MSRFRRVQREEVEAGLTRGLGEGEAEEGVDQGVGEAGEETPVDLVYSALSPIIICSAMAASSRSAKATIS